MGFDMINDHGRGGNSLVGMLVIPNIDFGLKLSVGRYTKAFDCFVVFYDALTSECPSDHFAYLVRYLT
jgi:hypothetical protein